MQYCNQPTMAGMLASKRETFGPNGRYSVAAVHTRGDAVSWFVWDSERTPADVLFDDERAVIRQEDSLEEATAGLGYQPSERADY